MPSSQLNTRHCRPRACASAFTLSVLPVPAGQNGLVSQRFLLFVPSLSWQKDRVYVKRAQKSSQNRARFFRYLRGRTGCHRSLGAYPAKNATLFEFSLCLSRACLGKPRLLYKKWTKVARFSHRREGEVALVRDRRVHQPRRVALVLVGVVEACVSPI